MCQVQNFKIEILKAKPNEERHRPERHPKSMVDRELGLMKSHAKIAWMPSSSFVLSAEGAAT